jgi:cysteinyl-tRNA synthetase
MDNGFKSKKAGMLLRLSREFIKNVVEEVLGVKLNLEVRLDEGLTGDLMNLILDIRLEAKKDKNYALADKIRDRLGELGVEIKDGRDKSTWTLKK